MADSALLRLLANARASELALKRAQASSLFRPAITPRKEKLLLLSRVPPGVNVFAVAQPVVVHKGGVRSAVLPSFPVGPGAATVPVLAERFISRRTPAREEPAGPTIGRALVLPVLRERAPVGREPFLPVVVGSVLQREAAGVFSLLLLLLLLTMMMLMLSLLLLTPLSLFSVQRESKEVPVRARDKERKFR